MWGTIKSLIPRDQQLPDRAWILDCLRRVLDGRLYEVLPHEFHEERGSGGEYIPLSNRRPSVRYNLCRLVVEDSVALLFSEGHFPTLEAPDPDIRKGLLALVKEARLARLMTSAAISGSVGSVAIIMRIFDGRVFFDVMNTEFMAPRWQPRAPDVLMDVTEKYKVRRAQLEAAGYTGLNEDFEWWWFQRRWDADREIWYRPWPVQKAKAGPREDNTRTVTHGLGFVPIVWIRNLPGRPETDSPADGACTFRAAVEIMIEMDYQLSQAGRGLKYSSDPTLLIKEPAFGEQEKFIRSADNALVVSEEGDAKLLEIGGTAVTAVIEYCRALREMGLEQIHGNRANADKLSAAQSGRALELMHQALIWLADHMRQSYGEDGLLELIRMVSRVSRMMPLKVAGKRFAPVPEDAEITLKWPPWFPPTGEDRVQEANGLVTLRVGGLLSRESGVKAVAETMDIENVEDEIKRIEADDKAILAGDQIPPTGRPVQTGPGPNGNQGKGGDTPP